MKNSHAFLLRLGLLVLLLSSSPAQIVETQTDTNSGAAVNCGNCGSGACSTTNTDVLKTMDEGGTAGSTEATATHPVNTNNEMFFFFDDSDGLGADCDAGTATIRLDITTGNADFTVTDICICQGTTEVGSSTGLSTDLSVDRNFSVTTSLDTGCDSNAVRVLICGDTAGGHGNISVGLTTTNG